MKLLLVKKKKLLTDLILYFVIHLVPLWRRRLCEGHVHPLNEFQVTRPDDISLATPRWE